MKRTLSLVLAAAIITLIGCTFHIHILENVRTPELAAASRPSSQPTTQPTESALDRLLRAAGAEADKINSGE